MTIQAHTLINTKLDQLPTELARQRAMTPLSIREVAAAVGIGYGMLSHYERGECLPGRATRLKLAQFYDVDTRWLFRDETRDEVAA